MLLAVASLPSAVTCVALDAGEHAMYAGELCTHVGCKLAMRAALRLHLDALQMVYVLSICTKYMY